MPRRLLHPARALAVVALATGLATAQAGSATASFQVNATVLGACTVAGSLMNFGSAIDPIAAALPLDATATLTVVCTNTTAYTLALDAGTNAGGAANFGTRSVRNGASTLGYQLYLNAGRTTVWGDGTGGSSTVAGTGTGASQLVTVYGRLPSLTSAIPGLYADTVTVTITY